MMLECASLFLWERHEKAGHCSGIVPLWGGGCSGKKTAILPWNGGMAVGQSRVYLGVTSNWLTIFAFSDSIDFVAVLSSSAL